MRHRLALALALLAAPASLAAQAQADSVPPAVSARPVAATRPVTVPATTDRLGRFCDRLDVMDHYTGRPAIVGAVIGAAGGVAWAMRMGSKSDASLAAPMFFVLGPAMGAGYGVGAGAVVGLGKWGWDASHGHAWRPGARDRARRQGLLCTSRPVPIPVSTAS